MKNLAIFVAMVLFLSCVTSQVTAKDLEDSVSPLGNEKLAWWHYHYYPHYYPYFHPKPHWPFPRNTGKAFPPLPAGHNFHPIPFHPPPVVAKCLSDCKDVRTCLLDIAKAFHTGKATIGTNCCASIQKMNDDCEKTVFGAYHNIFFNCYVKLACSSKGGSTPSAPSPA
ncbi:membrane lipoprotein [Arabis alpina]|uniref:Membrane lipoprotein n=1 Tax=Arabis alpina TaxID=50452 RepID=A0A087G7U2_ARAAL|nr:membrane lipoprotein [Arabis alpina]